MPTEQKHDASAMSRRAELLSGARRRRLSIWGFAGLAGLVSTAAIFLYYTGRELSFYLDEWYFLLYRQANINGFLDAHGGHIVVIPVAIYQVLLRTVGMTDYTPYRAVVIATHLLIGVLVYIFARQRIGPIASLGPAAIILFLGRGAEDFLWAFQIVFLGPILTGLAALMLAERTSLKARLSVCVLLVLSIGFSEIGLSFVLAVTVLLLTKRTRLKDVWIVIVPSILYGLWYMYYGYGNSSVTLANLIRSPKFIADEIAGSVQALTGLGPFEGISWLDLNWGRAFAVVLVVFVIRRLVKAKENRMLWSLMTAGGVFWALVAFTRAEKGNPVASRYIYIGSVIVALIILELAKGIELGNRAIGIFAAISIVIVGANVGYYYHLRNFFENNASYQRAEIGAIDIAKNNIDPNFVLSDSAHYIPSIQAGSYLSAISKYGSPAYSVAEIEAQTEPVRLATDDVFVRAGLLKVEQGNSQLSGGMRCQRVTASGATQPYVAELPSGSLVLLARSKQLQVSVRRFAQASTIDLGTLKPDAGMKISTTTDGANLPWRIVIAGDATFELCSSGS